MPKKSRSLTGHSSTHATMKSASPLQTRRSSLTETASNALARKSWRGTRVIDCKGKFILPGYIDTHIHFFQSADLFTRPDILNLNSVRPYRDEVAWIKSHLDDTFARYLRSGITSVVDVGGPFWNFDVRKRANS